MSHNYDCSSFDVDRLSNLFISFILKNNYCYHINEGTMICEIDDMIISLAFQFYFTLYWSKLDCRSSMNFISTE